MNWHERAATVLEDDVVRLRAIDATDREGIRSVAMDPDIWRYFVALVTDEASFETFFATMLADHAAGRRVVFHITDLATGRTAGSMSYGNLSEPDRRLEIGWSWLGRDFRGAGINRHAKHLLLRNAFERLGAERVEFKTDRRNEQARRALRNIGATEEGILRSFNPMPDGTRRDAAYYSVLAGEWPSVRDRLTAQAAAR